MSVLNDRTYRAYEFLGCHADGKGGYTFRVWAPNAAAVSVVGDFNGWNGFADPMTRDIDGIWSVTIGIVQPGFIYKYAVTDARGMTVL